MRIQAPAKINLCLFLGPVRADGLHELCSLFEPLALADSIEVSEAERDEVVCPGVEGEDLAARALAALREAGWVGPPLRIEIEKRIPVAAGLGGGSADAAAILRLARSQTAAHGWADPSPSEVSAEPPAAVGGVPDLQAIAAGLGADVPSQLVPALSLVQGAGERVERLPDPAPHTAVLLPGGGGLSTAEVFAEADRLGLGRSAAELEALAARLRAAAGAGASALDYADLLGNDLEPAARSLRPEIGATLDALREAGAPLVLMSGSGPTAVGLFPSLAAARQAAARLNPDQDQSRLHFPAYMAGKCSLDAIVCVAGRAP
jgi:4-diphosphocytidyl-2-C-methyl-D-erythritol kinase